MTHKIRKITIETKEGILELIPAKNDNITIDFSTEIVNVPQRDGDLFRRIKAGDKNVTIRAKLDNPYMVYTEK